MTENSVNLRHSVIEGVAQSQGRLAWNGAGEEENRCYGELWSAKSGHARGPGVAREKQAPKTF